MKSTIQIVTTLNAIIIATNHNAREDNPRGRCNVVYDFIEARYYIH